MICQGSNYGTLMEKREIELSEYCRKTAALYRSGQADRPLVVLNSYDGDGAAVMEAMRSIDAPECNLLVIGNLNWDHDMTPWYCPPVSENDKPFTGGADAYLELLLGRILPDAASMIKGTPAFTGIAGYSLAGLFALYAMYRCEAFDRAASMSGSLWFPDFREFVFSHEMMKKPGKLYLSVGDTEAKTRNPFMRTVRDNTGIIAGYYKDIGLDVTVELNPGNHFRDAALRTAKGIKAILE